MSAALAWLSTYLVHSTLLLGAAWVAQRALGDTRLRLQERILRLALVGAVLTATLQVALPFEPAAGSLSLAAKAAPLPAHAVSVRALAPAPSAPAVPEVPWPALALGLWALGAAGALLRLGVASLRLRRVLGGGRALVEGHLPRRARRLAVSLGLVRPVELRASRCIAVPFAAGIRRPRVCLPERVLTDLGGPEQEGLCAHELAHLQRRDPEWVLAYRIVAGTLFFQPLNHWATRQLGELSECLSDDLAARATGRASELARSLVEVADWTTGNAALPAATAVRASRGLGRRIDRLEELMRNPSPGRPPSGDDRRWLPLAALAVLVGAASLPGVSGRAAAAPPPPQDPAAAEAAELARIEAQLEEAAERAEREQAERAQAQRVERAEGAEREQAERAEEARKAERAEERRGREEIAAERARIRRLERDVERDLDEMAEEIEEALRDVEVDMEAITAEIQAAVELQSEEMARALAEVGPTGEERRRLESELQELGDVAGEDLREELEALRALRHEELEEQRQELEERRREQRQEVRALRRHLRRQAEEVRLSVEERGRIRERARESLPPRARLRELSRTLRQLTRSLVRSVWFDEPPEPPEPPAPPEPPEPAAVPAPPEPPDPPDPAAAPEPPDPPEAPEPAAAPAPPEPPEPPAAPHPRAAPAPPEVPGPPPREPAVRPDPRGDPAISADDDRPGVLPRPLVSV